MRAFIKLLILGIVIFIVLFIALIYRKSEPFANSVVVSNITSNPDEIFLVAPNTGNFKTNDAPDKFSYSANGFTYKQAEDACLSFGGRLADLNTVAASPSKLSVNVAKDLSANWCAAGWTASSTEYAYFPMTDFTYTKCRLSNSVTNGTTSETPGPGKFYLPTTTGMGVYKPVDGKAFAICVGKKPPLLETNKVHKFNNSSYSMYNENMMTFLRRGINLSNPYEDDIFPIEFTDAQVYNALQQVSPAYNISKARKWLITQYNTAATTATDPLNSNLYTAETNTERDQWENQPAERTCNALSSVYLQMDTQLTQLKTLFNNLNENVKDIIATKNDNGNIQSVVASICQTASKQSIESKACMRLLSIDYDILYKNKSADSNIQKNTIVDLNGLNFALRMRECEIQESLGNLQLILNEYPSNTTCSSTSSTLRTKYKDNLVMVNNVLTPINCRMYFDEYGEVTNIKNSIHSAPDKAFKIGTDIPYNKVDVLKLSIQEISPYFTSLQYKNLVSDVLNQLSVTLRSRLPEQFFSIKEIIPNTNSKINSITSIFSLLN
jgi:hypothetical protein